MQIPQFHISYSREEKRRRVKLALKLNRFEDWMEPEDVIPYTRNDNEISEYLYFINKGHLIPYLNRLSRNIYMTSVWAINNDVDFFVDLYRKFQYTAYINEINDAALHYYRRDILHRIGLFPDISREPLAHLRKIGDFEPIYRILDTEILTERDLNTVIMFGNEQRLDNLYQEGVDISYVAANQPELYRKYLNQVNLTEDVVLAAVRYGYYEVIESILPQTLTYVDDLIRNCLLRRFDQLRVLKLILSRHFRPITISVDDFRFIDIRSVEYLFSRGYNIQSTNNGIFTYSPESTLFLKLNGQDVPIPRSINTGPDKFVIALELLADH